MLEGKSEKDWLATLSTEQIKWITATLETVVLNEMTTEEINYLLPILRKEFLMRSVKVALKKGPE